MYICRFIYAHNFFFCRLVGTRFFRKILLILGTKTNCSKHASRRWSRDLTSNKSMSFLLRRQIVSLEDKPVEGYSALPTGASELDVA